MAKIPAVAAAQGGGDLGVGPQAHARIGQAVFQAHLHGQGSGRNGELVELERAAFNKVVGDEVGHAGGVEEPQLVGGVGAQRGEGVAAGAGANAVGVVGVSALADDGGVVGPGDDIAGAALGQQDVMLVAALLKEAPAGDVDGGRAAAVSVGEVVLLDGEERLAAGGREPEAPGGAVGEDLDAVIGRFLDRQGVRAGDPAVKGQVGHADGPAGPDAAARKGVAQRGGGCAVAQDAHVVGARAQGLAVTHGQELAGVVGSVGVAGVARPVGGGGPLIAGEPVRRAVGIIPASARVGAGGQVDRKAGPADDQARIAAGDVGEAQVPAQDVGGHLNDEILPFARRLVVDGRSRAGAVVKVHGEAGQLLAAQDKGAQGGGGLIDADVPDVGLVAGALEVALVAVVVDVGAGAGGGAGGGTVAVVPAAGHGVAAQGDLGRGDLVGQLQVPAVGAELFGGVDHAVEAPAGPGGGVVGDLEDVMNVGDDGLAVGQDARVGGGSVDGDVEGAVAEDGGHHGEAVAHGAGQVRIAVVDVFVGNVVAAHGHVSVADRGKYVDLPGDLLHGHLNAVGGVSVARGAEVGERIEVQVGDGLLARVEPEELAGHAAYAYEALVANVEVGRHDKHLAQGDPVIVTAAGAAQVKRGAGFVNEGQVGEVGARALVKRAGQVDAPGQGAGRHGGLEKAHPFRADGPDAAAAAVGGQGRELLNVGLAAQEGPLGPRGSVNGQEPVLAGVELVGLGQNEAVGARADGAVGVGVCFSAGALAEIDIGFAAEDLEGGAPGAAGGGLGGDAEVVIAARGAGVDIGLGARVGHARVPGQHIEPAGFGGQAEDGVGGRAGGEKDADEVSEVGRFGVVEDNRVDRLAGAAFVIGAGGGRLAAPHIQVGVRPGGAQDQAPAGHVGGHIDLKDRPAVAGGGVGETARRGEDRRFEHRIPGGAQIGPVGGDEHLEGLGGGGRRGQDREGVIGGAKLGRFQDDAVGLPAEPGNEIIVQPDRGAAGRQDELGVGRGVVGHHQRQVGGVRAEVEGEVGGLAWGVRPGEHQLTLEAGASSPEKAKHRK